MNREDKKKIEKWFKDHMRTHSDLTGHYVEYNQNCDNVDEFIQKFFNSIEEN